MAIIVNSNGVDVRGELKGLKKGRYVLLPMDEAPGSRTRCAECHGWYPLPLRALDV